MDEFYDLVGSEEKRTWICKRVNRNDGRDNRICNIRVTRDIELADVDEDDGIPYPCEVCDMYYVNCVCRSKCICVGAQVHDGVVFGVATAQCPYRKGE